MRDTDTDTSFGRRSVLLAVGLLVLAGYFVLNGQLIYAAVVTIPIAVGAARTVFLGPTPTVRIRHHWTVTLAFGCGFVGVLTLPVWWPVVADPVVGSLAHPSSSGAVDPLSWLVRTAIDPAVGRICSGVGCVLFVLLPGYVVSGVVGGAVTAITVSKLRAVDEAASSWITS